MGAIKPTDEEAKEMEAAAANQPPDPNAMYLQAAAQSQLADAANKQANTELTHAKVGQTNADTITKLASVQQDQAQHALAVVQHVDNQQLQREQMAQQPQHQPAGQ
jgi:hypothetical protein